MHTDQNEKKKKKKRKEQVVFRRIVLPTVTKIIQPGYILLSLSQMSHMFEPLDCP